MYTLLDVIGDAERRALKIVLADRVRYNKFIKVAEEYVISRKLTVGGNYATQLLLGASDNSYAPPEVGLSSYQCTIYCNDALKHTRAIADAIYKLDPDDLAHYTVVGTTVADKQFNITVNGRALITVLALPLSRGGKPQIMLIPSIRPAQFAVEIGGSHLDINCVGPEIQLMEVYDALCNPSQSGRWEELLITESKLRKILCASIRKKIEGVAIIGGGGGHSAIHTTIRDKFASDSGRVLIGQEATELITNKTLRGGGRLQVISNRSLESEAMAVAALAKRAGVLTEWKIEDPKIPTNYRLRRVTVYAVGKKRYPIIDIYNAAAFDLIPYTMKRDHGAPANIKLGTPFVIMRYRLIDMWTIQLLGQMGVIDTSYVKRLLFEIIDGYEAIADYYEMKLTEARLKPELTAAAVLPISAYEGQLELPELALKRTSSKRFYHQYFPAQAQTAKGGGEDLNSIVDDIVDM